MKNKNFIRILIFNIIETFIIFLIGNIFNVDIYKRIMFMVLFFLTRMIIGKPKHYNKAYRCALWSFLVFISLYSLSNLDMFSIILLTIFTGFVSTGKADINDMFMWKGSDLNQQVFEWVKFNQDNKKLIEYEHNLEKTDKRKYFIYIYRFKEFKKYSEIAELMETDPQRISDEVKIMSHFIEYSIRLSSNNEEDN